MTRHRSAWASEWLSLWILEVCRGSHPMKGVQWNCIRELTLARGLLCLPPPITGYYYMYWATKTVAQLWLAQGSSQRTYLCMRKRKLLCYEYTCNKKIKQFMCGRQMACTISHETMSFIIMAQLYEDWHWERYLDEQFQSQ